MSTLGNDSKLLHPPERVVSDELSELGDPEDGEVVVESLSFGEISFERVVPVDGISSVGEIFFNQDWGGERERE